MKKDSVLPDLQESWKSEWQRISFRFNLALAAFILVGLLLFSTQFLIYTESRPGIPLNDILLSYLPGYDLSGFIFFLIYSSVIIGLSHLSQNPYRLIPAFYVYSTVLSCRMLSIYFFPLEAPTDIIVLRDPFVEFFTGAGNVLTKDLFFSGHTSTLYIVYVFTKNKYLRIFFLLSTIAVGIMLLIQHVHYTMDVIAAPFVVFGAYRLVLKIYRKSGFFSFSLRKAN